MGYTLNSIKKDTITSLLSIKDSNDNVRTILGNLGETYYLQYKKTNNPKDLKSSIQFFTYADLIIENYFKSDVSLASKLLWRKEASKTYSRAIRSCYEANDTESALYFIEKK